MILILLFALISTIMLLIAYNISKNVKLESELTLQQYVEQVRKNKNTIILFTLFTYFGGGMILDPKSRKIIGLALMYNIAIGILGFFLIGSLDSSIGLTSSGKSFVALYIILLILLVRVYMLMKYLDVINKHQKKANNELNSLNEEKKIEANKLKQQQLNEEKKYTSEKFIVEVKKIYKLKENDIITNEEYIIRFDNLLEDLKKIGLKENKEDFLVGIITLKENGIIDKDVLSKIKNIVHPSIINNTENSIKDNSSQALNNLKYNSNKLVNELTRIFDFKNSGLYTEEEYSKRKVNIIINVINEGINENLEDFLLGLIPLKEKGVLSLDDITQIKSSLSPKNGFISELTKIYNLKVNEVYTEESISNVKNNVTKNVEIANSKFRYFCCSCNAEIELEPRELKNKRFVCPDCRTLNKI